MMPLCSLLALEGLVGWVWGGVGWDCTELMQQNIDKTPEGKAAAG